jgi:hypothetical protein
MITPSHLIYSWALAKKTENAPLSQKRTVAFVLGALFPDTPTYLFFVVCGLILGYSGEAMWDDMYFNSGWSIPITLTHSFIIWPLMIAVSSYFSLKFLKWFSVSALFHNIVDFFVHTDDAYRHFYPFSDWKFHSPISYWNSAEYGAYVSAFDSLLVLGLLTYLYTKYAGTWRVLIILIGSLYLVRLVAEPILMLFMHHGA